MTYKHLYINTICLLLITFLYSYSRANNTMVSDSVIMATKYSAAMNEFRVENYNDAFGLLNEILEQKDKLKWDYPPEYFKIYNFMGVIQKKKGFLDKAIDYYHLATQNMSNIRSLAGYYNNIANIYTFKGDFSNATSYLFKSLDILEEEEDKNYELIAVIYHNLGFCNVKSGNYGKAVTYSKKSLEILSNYFGTEDGETYHNCGIAYKMLDSLNQAKDCYNKAIECNIRHLGKNHYMTAMSYMNYAGFYLDVGDYVQSDRLYKKAYRILSGTLGEKHLYTSYCHKHNGNLLYKQGYYRKALENYQKSLISKLDNFNDTSIYKNPNINVYLDLDLIEVLKAKATAFEKFSVKENLKQNLRMALKTFEITVDVIEKLRAGYLYESSKLALSDREHDVYMSIIRISYKLWKITGDQQYINIAFKYSEQSKYAVLRELMNEDEAKAESVPDSLSQKEQNIRKLIGALRIQIDNESKIEVPNSEKVSSLKDSLFRSTQKLELISAKIEENYPEFSKLRNRSTVAEINELQRNLREDQVAFEYVLSDSLLFTFFITKGNFEFRKEHIDSSFHTCINFFTRYLHSEYSLSYDTFRISAYRLYRSFLKPYENSIRDKSLLIIPDEEFSLISFDALVDEPFKDVEGADYGLEPYLIRKYPIGYAYSSSLYIESLKKTFKGKNKILALAPSYEHSKDSLPILPVPKRFLKRLTWLSGRLFIEEDATETNFKQNLPKYNILHLYAHGYEDRFSPELSRIFFADKNDSLNDGYLFAHEINTLNINAKLVVLASCYSGSGKISEGEGIISLGRSFLNAGGYSMVLSLWRASFEPTIEELNSFHKHLLRGKRKDEALRLAKLKYLKNSNALTAHPRYWSSLIIVGSQSPIYVNIYYKLIIFVFLLVIFFIIRKGLRNRRKANL